MKQLEPNFAGDIRCDTRSPLILVTASGDIRTARTRGEKDALIAACSFESDTLLWPWVGQWSTDVFRLTQADIEKHYRRNK